ncbi:MAG: hypothetical protein ACM30I_08165 [Gemmatimonas sp.]
MRTCIVFLAVLAASIAVAQTTPERLYDVKTYGVFRDMMLQGDFTPKIRLADAMAQWPTTGVGALADARGEITITDGKLVVSYGKPGDHPSPDSESAALLAMGRAADWHTVDIDNDVPPQEVERYIGDAARARGIPAETSFPFELRGVVVGYVMHVNAEPTDGPHGMGLPMAVTGETSGDELSGKVAGLYVSADLMGVATHGGERIHAHWVSDDDTATAHLDRWGIKAGSTLLLPAN